MQLIDTVKRPQRVSPQPIPLRAPAPRLWQGSMRTHHSSQEARQAGSRSGRLLNRNLVARLLFMARTVLFVVVGSAVLIALALLGLVGQILFCVLAAIALYKKLESRFIFSLALLALLGMSALQFIGLTDLAQKMAFLTYACLVAGALLLGLEARRKSKFGFRP